MLDTFTHLVISIALLFLLLLMATDTDRLSCNLHDWQVAGLYNMTEITFSNFYRRSSIFQVSVVLASEIVKMLKNLYMFYFRTLKYQTNLEHAKKCVLGPVPILGLDHKALEFEKYFCI